MKRLLIPILAAVMLYAVACFVRYYTLPPEVQAQTNTFCAANLACTVTGAWTYSGAVITKTFNSVAYANQFAGADIFAQANAAITASCPGGKVVIPPGTYNTVTTTLSLLSTTDTCTVEADGVTINFTNTTGTAILVAHTTKTKIIGNMVLIGPGTGTSSIGIQLGSAAAPAQQTINNSIEDIRISGFGKGFVGEGSTTNGGTYYNVIKNVAVWRNGGLGNGIGFFLKPTTLFFFNNNTFVDDSAQWSVTDGWVLDGADNNTYTGGDSENNSGCGMRIGDTQSTVYSTLLGMHFETNTTADFCSLTPANISQFWIAGGPTASTTTCQGAGGCRSFWLAGSYNNFMPAQTPWVTNPVGGTIFSQNINANAPSGFNLWEVNNGESPVSGLPSIIQVNRAGANNGNLLLGTPEYPITMNSTIKPGVAGARDVGTTALPFGNVFLGTAATNNFKVQPGTTTGARIITVTDPVTPTTVGLPLTIASGTKALNTASVTTATCDAGVTASASGVLSTDVVNWSFNAAPTATNKYGAFLAVYAVPSANTVTFYTCNPSATTSTPTAMTINFTVVR